MLKIATQPTATCEHSDSTHPRQFDTDLNVLIVGGQHALTGGQFSSNVVLVNPGGWPQLLGTWEWTCQNHHEATSASPHHLRLTMKTQWNSMQTHMGMDVKTITMPLQYPYITYNENSMQTSTRTWTHQNHHSATSMSLHHLCLTMKTQWTSILTSTWTQTCQNHHNAWCFGGRFSVHYFPFGENLGCLTWLRHSSCRSSATHYYECV